MHRFTLLYLAVSMAVSMAVHGRSELIVLASPLSDDPYYQDVRQAIFDFHIEFAKQISSHDRYLILTDNASAPAYISALGEQHVVIAPMQDIWMRDFSLSNPTGPVMFRYTAAAQDDQASADEVQDSFFRIIRKTGLAFSESDLLNDGGNFVDDYAGNVVISTKFLSDNNLTERQARAVLTQHNTIDRVAFIDADEQGGLEHADGVVSFIDTNTLLINRYPDDPDYSQQLLADLRRGLPGVIIHEIDAPYDSTRIYDQRFGSACGLYTNALVTPERIYLPQFGIPEDKPVLAFVRTLTRKQVIPVRSDKVCFMGGGVRCMTWQLRGGNARRLISAIKSHPAVSEAALQK